MPGSTESSANPIPPFAYGKVPPAFPMTDGNSLPGLVVWLFLVTNPDFLYTLDAPNGDQSLVPVDQIAAATNLTQEAVNAILDKYRKRVKGTTNHFMAVAETFQQLAQDNGYPIGNCPGKSGSIIGLALKGAAVDPNAKDAPAV